MLWRGSTPCSGSPPRRLGPNGCPSSSLPGWARALGSRLTESWALAQAGMGIILVVFSRTRAKVTCGQGGRAACKAGSAALHGSPCRAATSSCYLFSTFLGPASQIPTPCEIHGAAACLVLPTVIHRTRCLQNGVGLRLSVGIHCLPAHMQKLWSARAAWYGTGGRPPASADGSAYMGPRLCPGVRASAGPPK
jgi:hypothetical protein